jgi:hypothetical protein
MRAMGLMAAALVALAATAHARAAEPGHVILHVRLAPTLAASSGRLLVFAQPLAAGAALEPVDADPFAGDKGAWVAARELGHIAPGETVDIDLDTIAYPAGFSQLPAGDYAVQAVLDVNHDYNYGGRGAGDVISAPTRISLPAASGAMSLDQLLPAREPWTGGSPESQARQAAARPDVQAINFTSPSLTAFWGRPVAMKGWVVTPPGYAAGKGRYPTVYETHGFGGSTDNFVGMAGRIHDAMAKGKAPPMIWVLLDQSSATGTHEFADGVNNGPWGKALTEELIPDLEKRYRMDARASGRFLNGHSSGGWATLWLQVRYPKLFGGTWSTSPDPSDFHDFTGVDLYAPGVNIYRAPDGSPRPLVRDKGKVLGTFEQFVRLEETLGEYGGQLRSFDWVFSPRGPDGRPAPMFDRATGAVDPAVVAYWREHYDIAARLSGHWPALKGDLDGKVHLIVGTADTFYLDGAAHKLEAVMKGLGARTDFRYLPGRTHFDLYRTGDDHWAMLNDIAWEMHAVARPGVKGPDGAKPAP